MKFAEILWRNIAPLELTPALEIIGFSILERWHWNPDHQFLSSFSNCEARSSTHVRSKSVLGICSKCKFEFLKEELRARHSGIERRISTSWWIVGLGVSPNGIGRQSLNEKTDGLFSKIEVQARKSLKSGPKSSDVEELTSETLMARNIWWMIPFWQSFGPLISRTLHAAARCWKHPAEVVHAKTLNKHRRIGTRISSSPGNDVLLSVGTSEEDADSYRNFWWLLRPAMYHMHESVWADILRYSRA